MDAREWLEAYAGELGGEVPGEDEVNAAARDRRGRRAFLGADRRADRLLHRRARGRLDRADAGGGRARRRALPTELAARLAHMSRLCDNRARRADPKLTRKGLEMATQEKVTYCRICEPLCGMVATVEDGALTKVRPDADNPLSKGFACPKGIAMADVHNDPDRVLHPLRRKPDGSFERVTWPEAIDEIGRRLGKIVDRDGGDAVGWYMGNPGAFSYSHPLWVKGFLDALGSPHSYTASSQDVSNRFAASWFLYGAPFIVPIPDLARTDFLFMVGANPLVSHGSVLTAPRIKDKLHAITERGGRVVVVDPRRSETARAFEHVASTPTPTPGCCSRCSR